MADTTEKENDTINLPEETGYSPTENRFLVGALAWLIPGAGHLYQKRYVKAAIFFLSIMPILLIGIWMGSYWNTTLGEDGKTEIKTDLNIGRNIWFSWRDGDRRLYFFPQAMIGTVGLTAFLQSQVVSNGNPPFLCSIFAPPSFSGQGNQPTIDTIIARLNSYYDLGILFTMVAGLMNILAIFDAIGGPVILRAQSEEEKK